MPSTDELFKGRHSTGTSSLSVYLQFKLTFRYLAEMMAERGINLALNGDEMT